MVCRMSLNQTRAMRSFSSRLSNVTSSVPLKTARYARLAVAIVHVAPDVPRQPVRVVAEGVDSAAAYHWAAYALVNDAARRDRRHELV